MAPLPRATQLRKEDAAELDEVENPLVAPPEATQFTNAVPWVKLEEKDMPPDPLAEDRRNRTPLPVDAWKATLKEDAASQSCTSAYDTVTPQAGFAVSALNLSRRAVPFEPESASPLAVANPLAWNSSPSRIA